MPVNSRRRRSWDDIFEKDDGAINSDHHRRFSLDMEENVEPKPYQYGIVGQVTPPAVSPPQSPSLPPTLRRSSMTPLTLNLPNTPSAPGHSVGSSAPPSSRPSTAGSMQPLQSRPSASQSHSHNSSLNSPAFSVGQWNANSAAIPLEDLHRPAEDFLARSGSPTSLQEQRRLQIVNPPLSPSPPPTPQQTNFFGMASGSSDPNPNPNNIQQDGKGRFVLNPPGEPVVVHRDGGRLDSGSVLPPAYTD